MWILALVAIAATACGRLGFDPAGGPGGDANGDGPGAGDAAAGDGPPPPVVSTLCPNAVKIAAGRSPSLAWSGSQFGVAFLDGSVIRFARISPAGVPTGTPTALFTAGSGFDSPTQVSLIWNATEWVAAFDGLGIHATRIDAAGAEIGTEITVDAATNSAIPSFAQGGGLLRLSWTAYGGSDFQLMTASMDGQLGGLTITPVTNNMYSSLAGGAAYTGSTWALVWDDSKFTTGCVAHGLYFNEVRASGAVSGGGGERYQYSCTNIGNTERHRPVAAWNGVDLSLAWSGTGTDQSHVYAARMSAASGALSTTPIVPTSRDSRDAAITWTGSELGIAWDSSGGGVFITRSQAAGTPIAEIAIDAAAGRSPSIAWDGAAYGVAYEVSGAIYFARTCP